MPRKTFVPLAFFVLCALLVAGCAPTTQYIVVTATPAPAAGAVSPEAPAASATAAQVAAATVAATVTVPATREPAPIATQIPPTTEAPAATATQAPPSATSVPVDTDTPEPADTATPQPAATPTPEPTATDTAQPSDTPEPTATDTPAPTVTPTPGLLIQKPLRPIVPARVLLPTPTPEPSTRVLYGTYRLNAGKMPGLLGDKGDVLVYTGERMPAGCEVFKAMGLEYTRTGQPMSAPAESRTDAKHGWSVTKQNGDPRDFGVKIHWWYNATSFVSVRPYYVVRQPWNVDCLVPGKMQNNP